MKVGPINHGNGKFEFVVWAPHANQMTLRIFSTNEQTYKMNILPNGYWSVVVNNVAPDTTYYYLINNERERPDPASNFQPQDVHGPSQVVDHEKYKWTDQNWNGIPLTNYILYELHVGTFTEEGTFTSAINKLDYLCQLGITAIEIMPVAQFPGNRNWGYDGVYPFAPQSSYGGVEALKNFVDVCHSKGLAVVLDVVYNHLGPSGNYLRDFGPYFIDKYKTPWGMAVNFDDEYSDEVRNYFIENALFWLENYHFDALRIDAVHSIFDFGAKHFLAELNENIESLYHKNGKKYFIIVESDLNDVRLITPIEQGGYGCDAQWSDDFHHALHSALTGEKSGYYMDFGKIEHVASALKNSFVYSGIHSAYRKKRHGNDASGRPTYQFVVSIQNHDQIGNRAFGERLSQLVPFEALKLAAAAMILSPYIPMLFMGEEYAEESPFLYFISHSEPELIEAVQKGRKAEFKAFKWTGSIPDPQSEETFDHSKLNWHCIEEDKHRTMLEFYRELINLRKSISAFQDFSRDHLDVKINEEEKIVFIHRNNKESSIYSILNLNNIEVTTFINLPEGRWKKILDSADKKWMGKNSSTPSMISNRQDITINEFSLSVYEKV
ncbi:MAG: malto-oligosyltrehalose trehalohydrolase [Bacteroidota bacterium]|nr:malto-oligosyltrehalose trehalohydrolase [Bacteroidota bacterium]MDP4191307.1 malto-oligosyltrehalose trehalohydrolase [Bacteroidota bacterium]MDP4195174.1 malto-oligosyltrehalose trehalohydrolase [Bacteroidota bacterium]